MKLTLNKAIAGNRLQDFAAQVEAGYGGSYGGTSANPQTPTQAAPSDGDTR